MYLVILHVHLQQMCPVETPAASCPSVSISCMLQVSATIWHLVPPRCCPPPIPSWSVSMRLHYPCSPSCGCAELCHVCLACSPRCGRARAPAAAARRAGPPCQTPVQLGSPEVRALPWRPVVHAPCRSACKGRGIGCSQPSGRRQMLDVILARGVTKLCNERESASVRGPQLKAGPH